MRSVIFFLVFIIGFHAAYAQQGIKGIVKDEKGQAVTGANILLKNGSGLIIKFSHTDREGNYTILIHRDSLTDGYFLEVKHISYKTTKQSVDKNRLQYDFVLTEEVQALKEVLVKQPPIVKRGDTTRYKVSAFANEEDRNIEDVLKRMPGISIEEDGTIYFNGKKIGNLFTDWDDLMGGRYGAATKAIKKEMIESVELVENHQPIRVLQNRKTTENVSLNLVLKDANSWKVSGIANAGVGLPEQYTTTVNTVMLNKKVKTINTFKVNNAGEDYRNEISRLNTISNTEVITLSEMLSSGTTGNPDLPRRNYYINRSGLVNINYLFKNKKDVQFRTNIQAFTDRQILNYNSRTLLFTATDTIAYFEKQETVKRPSIINAEFSIHANKPHYYFNNRTNTEVEWQRDRSYLQTQAVAFDQKLSGRLFSLANEFHFIPLLKSKAVAELKWNINYGNRPATLLANEGLHAQILNNGLAYEALTQEMAQRVLHNQLQASYLLTKKNFRQQYKLLFLQENRQLETELQLLQNNGQWNKYMNDAGNNLTWNRYRTTLQSDYSWVVPNKSEIGFSIPVISQTIHYKQAEYDLAKRYNRLWVNPAVMYKRFLNAQESFSASYVFKNTLSDIHTVYRGLILANYRSLQANDVPLQERSTHNAGIGYSFQRTLHLLFLNGGITIAREKVNTLLSSRITDNIQRNVLLQIPNTRTTWGFNVGGSKYVYFLKATVTLKNSYSINRMQQYINETLIPINFNAIASSLTIDKKLFGNIMLNYAAGYVYSFMKQDLKMGTNSRMHRLDQQLTGNYTLLKGLLLQVKMRSIYSETIGGTSVNYLFTDMRLRYHIKPWKTDMEFDCTNIANINNYELLRVDATHSSSSSYDIRGRLMLLKFTFNF